jgi:Fe-S-cluster containining protein
MVYCLAQHAGYACRHSGACCSSGWPIIVEPSLAPLLRAAVAEGRLQVEPDGVPEGQSSDADALLPMTADGRCGFRDAEGRRCRVHAALGHDRLPTACQHFPRRCRLDGLATCVSLSHYCPTVARMAFDAAAPRGIVKAPASLVGHLRLEGLDARDALPPLLRPGLLTGLEGYHAWEAALVDRFEAGDAPERAMASVRTMTERLADWQPRDGRFEDAVRAAAARADVGAGTDGWARSFCERANDHEHARLAVPEFIRPAGDLDGLDAADDAWVEPAWDRFAAPIGRFMAAHAFGNWSAYFCSGLTGVVRTLEAVLAGVRVEAARECRRAARPLDEALLIEAFRSADLLLVHLGDPEAFATGLDRRVA